MDFPEGIRVFRPRDNAPNFVKADVLVNKSELIKWLAGQPSEVRLQIKESKKGTWYFDVNDFKPKTQPTGASDNSNDLPF